MGQSHSVNETTTMAMGAEQYPVVVQKKNTKDRRRRGTAGRSNKGQSSSSSSSTTKKSVTAASFKKKTGKLFLLVTSKRQTTKQSSTSTTTTPTKENKQPHAGAAARTVSSTSTTPLVSNRKTDRTLQEDIIHDSNHVNHSSPSEDTVDTQPETPSPLSKTDNDDANHSLEESPTTTTSSNATTTTSIQLNDELLLANHHQFPTSLPRIGEELEHELYSSSSYSSSSQKSQQDKKKKSRRAAGAPKNDKHATNQITLHDETRSSSHASSCSTTGSAKVSSLAHSHVASVPTESRSHRPPPPTVQNRRSRRRTPPTSSSSSQSSSSRASGGSVAVFSQRHHHMPAPPERSVSDQTLAVESDDGIDVGSESDDSSVASYGKRMGVALRNSFKAAKKLTKHTNPNTTTAANVAETLTSVANNNGTANYHQNHGMDQSTNIMGLTIMPNLFSISEDHFVSSSIIVPPPKSPPRASSIPTTTATRTARKPDTKRRNANTLPPRLTSVQSILHHPISQPPRVSNKVEENDVVSWVPDTIAGSDSESVSSVGSASSKGSVLSCGETVKRATLSTSGAAIDPLLVSQFNKLKVQAKLSRHNERKMQKMQSRLDRKKQASEYEELWRNFEKLRDSESEYESVLASDDNSTAQSMPLSTKDKPSPSKVLQEQRRQRRAAKAFSLHNSRTWFVDFDSFEEMSEDETSKSMQLLEPMIEPARSQHESEKAAKEFLEQNKEFYDKNVKRRRRRRKLKSGQNSALSDDDSSMASNDSSTSFYEEFLKFRRSSKKKKSQTKSDETSPTEVNENVDTENEGDSHNRILVDIEQSVSYDGDECTTDGIRMDLVPSNAIASSVKKSFFEDVGRDQGSFQSPMMRSFSGVEGSKHGKALTAPVFLKVHTNDYKVQRRRRVHSDTDIGRSQSRRPVGKGEDLESIFDKEGISDMEVLTDATPSILPLSRDTGLSLRMFSDSNDKSFSSVKAQDMSDTAGLKEHDRKALIAKRDDARASPAPSTPICKKPERRRVNGLTDSGRLRAAVGSPAKYVTDSQETARRLEGLKELERLRNADGSLIVKTAILRTGSDDEQLVGRTSRLDSIKELARLRSVLPKETSSNLPESPNGATHLGDGKYSI